MHVSPFEIKNTSCEKLLRIQVDSRLNFDEHLDGIIKKSSRKTNALSRITSFMNTGKRRIILNSFYNPQFNFSCLVWMLQPCSTNNKINCLHERTSLVVYGGFSSSFENLLKKDRIVSMLFKNLQKLPTEMFKISKNFYVPLINELFHQKVNHYDPQNPYEFSIPHVNSVFDGQKSI